MARNKYDVDEVLEDKFDVNQLKRLLAYLIPYRKRFVSVGFMMLSASAFTMLIPQFFQKVMDVCIPNKDMKGIAFYSFLTLLAAFYSAFSLRYKIKYTNQIGQQIIHDMRYDIFEHLQELPFSYYDDRPHGKIQVRVVNYVNSISDLLSNGILNTITDLCNLVFIIVFKYFAYTGLSVAFLDYKIGKGYAGSKFVGLKIFEKVFKHRDFTKAVVNTLLLNVLDLIFSFPMPIILALLLNEIRVKWFKRTTQTLLYLPHFLSWVVIGAVAYQMFATQSGVVNALIANAGKSPIPFLQEDGWWLFSYVLIGVWQTMGWGTIIYLAAITNVNSELYEAAKVDGANRWQQCLHVTLPCIRSTIVVMLIMQLGKLMGGSFERIVALSNAKATEFTTTIPVLVYKWFQGNKFSESTALGLFQSVIGVILVIASDRVAKKLGEDGLL